MSDIQEDVLIRCADVSFQYGESSMATRGVSLDLRKGEVIFLIGPNGAGKTTLIRQICAQLFPTTGSVSICGIDTRADALEARRHLGIVPQAGGLFDELEVEEHIRRFAALKLIPRNEIEAATEQVISLCGIDSIRRKRVRELSGGQGRIVMIALAILGSPPALILDEPTTSLDPAARRRIWNLIHRLKSEGKSLLLTSHYLEEAEALADRIVVLRDGEIIRSGGVSELLDWFEHRVRLEFVEGDRDPSVGVHYFETRDEAQDFVARKQIEWFRISPVTLEDVYLRIAGNEDGSEND